MAARALCCLSVLLAVLGVALAQGGISGGAAGLLFGAPCSYVNQCVYKNAACALSNSTCACKENFSPFNSTYCGKRLGANCSDVCNDIPNAECIDRVCSCPKNFVDNIESDKCFPNSTKFGSPCEIGPQCTATWGNLAGCFNGRCGCQETYAFNKTGCFEIVDEIGDSCDSFKTCYLHADNTSQNIGCVDGKCTCDADYKPSQDNRRCERGAAALHLVSISSFLFLFVVKLVT